MSHGTSIDYKTLRRINPETARRPLEYLEINGGTVGDVARMVAMIRRTGGSDLERSQ